MKKGEEKRERGGEAEEERGEKEEEKGEEGLNLGTCFFKAWFVN